MCPRCGASFDFVPKPERAKNGGATFNGVVAAIVVEVVAPVTATYLASRANAVTYDARGRMHVGNRSPIGAAADLFALLAICAALVVLFTNKREKPLRAFAFAFLMTTVGLVALTALLLVGLFVACLIGISAYSQHH